MSDSDTPLEVQAVYAIEQIVEEAADKRWPLDSDTVEDAMEIVSELQESNTPLSDELLTETQDSLERIHHLVDGAPKRSVDHMAVQEVVDDFVDECLDEGIEF